MSALLPPRLSRLALLALLALSCQPAPSPVPFEESFPLSGAGLMGHEGRHFRGDPTVTDAPRLDSLHALLRRGSWRQVDPSSTSIDLEIRLQKDSTTVGVLWMSDTHVTAVPWTRDPVALSRRLQPGERQMLERWFLVPSPADP